MIRFFATAFYRAAVPALALASLLTSATHAAEKDRDASDQVVTFNRDVRPILSEHCFECHGPDANQREAELRLDVRASAIESAITPGDVDSLLIERILSDDAESLMPPPTSKKPLSQKQIDVLRRWVEQGAAYEKHWSLIPIRRPKVPDGVANPIDFFIERRLKQEGLEFSSEADRRTLLRRVTLDLTGLPPTPKEVERFLSDKHPKAYERAVDRLLASQHYGEHMALPWLEAARYADTSGYQADWERFMWPWRNWVIDAFNANMPFDQFTIEQLAGDMLPNATPDQILATGFNRNHRINDEGGVIAAEYAVEYVVDRVDTTSTVWLGLTMGCCRCHDHKYDPLSQQDFYNMFALFNNVPEKGKDGRLGYSLPILDYPDPLVAGEVARLTAAVEKVDADLWQAAQQAKPERKRWMSELGTTLSDKQPIAWSVIKNTKQRAFDGTKLSELEDGSLLASGANPKRPRYLLTAAAKMLKRQHEAKPLTAVRLEALLHDSHTNQSLSRSVNGNFVLTDFSVTLIREKQRRPLKFSRALADYSQESFDIAQAIDADAKSGWAVNGNSKREDRVAVFVFAEPVHLQAGDKLQIQLRHDSKYEQHAVGRFRLSATSVPTPSLGEQSPYPPLVLAALQKSTSNSATTLSSDETLALNEWFAQTSPLFAEIRAKRDALKKELEATRAKLSVKVMVMGEMETPRKTFLLKRGEYDQPDKTRPAEPNVPEVFGGLPGEAKHNRLGFAKWLVAKENPLTARVAVNRFWQSYFGSGLVPTVEDFGSQGTPPTHPELLDWLASEFQESGWNVKSLQKRIVMSQTYRQTSVVRAEHLELDPENRLLARAPRLRLSGYQLRDQALVASQLLVGKLGGPSVKPYQPAGLWSEFSFQDKKRSTDFYVQDHGEKLYRRGLYTFWKRSVAPPMLANFDAAGREMCTVRLTRTSTPMQALNLMNDVTFVEAARAIGQRMILEGGKETGARIQFALSLFGASPRQQTVKQLTQSYGDYQKHFANNEDAVSEFLSNGEWKHKESLDPVELASCAAIASVIMNLDEVIVRQ